MKYKKFVKVIFAGYILLLIILVIGAVFNLGSSEKYYIKSNYTSGEKLQGWINISFNNQPSDSKIKDNQENSILLLDLLKKSTSFNYLCSVKTCGSGYSLDGNGVQSTSFILNNEKNIGLNLIGENIEIKKFSLNAESNSESSCNKQLEIDIGQENSSIWANKKYTSDSCGEDIKSSCNNGDFPELLLIGTQTYCEKIKLPKAPAFEVKTYVVKDPVTSPVFSNGLLIASIYNPDKELVGKCNLTAPSNSGSFISCIVNYASTKNEDHFVCISTKELDLEPVGYRLQARPGAPCGFLGDPATTENLVKDYNIVVSAKKFDRIGILVINETTFEEQNPNADSLISYLNNYLTNNYENNCSSGCILPIRLYGLNQNIGLNSLEVEYSSEGSAGAINKLIYNLTKSPSLISSGFIKINLDLLNFSLSNGNKTIKLFIDNTEIARQNITVNTLQISEIRQIYPNTLAGGIPTWFTVFINPSINKSNLTYSWDFGDNTGVQITSTNKIKHTYSSIGSYTLVASIIKNNRKGIIKNINITVQSPKNAINSTIKNYKTQINMVSSELTALPAEYNDIIKDKIDINEIKSKVDSIEVLYKQKINSAISTDEDYINLINELTKINVPISVEPSITSDLEQINDINLIDLDKIAILTDSNYKSSNSEKYKNEITAWVIDNVKFEMKYKLYSIFYEEYNEDLISDFELILTPLKEIKSPVYLIIEYDKDKIIFSGDYNPRDLNGATGVVLDLSSGAKTIKFALPEKADFFEIPIYLSPKLSSLNVESTINIESGTFWNKLLIGLSILLFVSFIVYIMLQEWYKKNYESSLFKDKNQLYNLIYFIGNAKRQRLDDNQIKQKLKKEGWKGEQITYAIRKFYGKRVGMWEIPIFYFRDRKKLREEMEKRNSRRVVY